MRLYELSLKNFQGIKDFTLDLSGKSAVIYGDNATGKSTIVNAYTWLLFGKPANESKSFTPKTRTADGEAHGLDHRVTARFEDGSRRVELSKVFHEIYKKKRGSIREEFDGHTIDYYVDGVPVKEKEYAAEVGKLWNGDDELAKILTMPEYFSSVLPWMKRRAFLLDMCGDVTDADVFAYKSELADLEADLGGRSVDGYQKMKAATRKAINDRLNELPGRLDEAQRAVDSVPTESEAVLLATIDRLEAEKADIFSERQASMGGAVDQKRAEASKLRADAKEAESAYRSRCATAINASREAISSLKEKRAALIDEKFAENKKLTAYQMRASDLEKNRKELLEKYSKLSSMEWDESEGVCPCCQRPLPEEKVAQMRSDFHLRKSVSLAEINQKGKTECSREMIDDLIAKATAKEATVAEISKRIAAMDEEIERLKSEAPTFPPFEETVEGAEYAARIADADRAVFDADKCAVDVLKAYNDRILAKNEEIRVVREKLAAVAVAERQRARVCELSEEQKRLAAEFEQTERMIFLCEEFIRAKVALLNDRINDHFKTVRFSLFSEQINGGIREECEVMIPNADTGAMVPFAFANTAARINAGIEIIEAVSEHYGASLPLFVDNAESVTRIQGGAMQQILLAVSAQDKVLRVEVKAC